MSVRNVQKRYGMSGVLPKNSRRVESRCIRSPLRLDNVNLRRVVGHCGYRVGLAFGRNPLQWGRSRSGHRHVVDHGT